MKIVLESKACSAVIQILRKYSIFCSLPFFTYLKQIVVNLLFPFLDVIFVIADRFKLVEVT